MTWDEFKTKVESAGVKDAHEIDYIDVEMIGDDIIVEVHGDGFFVVTDEEWDDDDDDEPEEGGDAA